MSALGPFDPSAIGFPGGAPAFPGTDTLTPDAFKVVVGSWRRINPGTSSTSDFACDLSTYAPRGPFVKKVQLVDVQVPSTQYLIERPWCRLWCSMGIPMTPDFCRVDADFTVGSHSVSVAVVFPLAINPAVAASVIQPGVTRVVFAQAAPCPAQAVVAAWNAMGGQVTLAGIPGLPALVLDKDQVLSPGIPTAIDILSLDLATAVATPGFDPACMFLLGTRIPSDDALARAVSWGLTSALQSCGLAKGPTRCLVAYCSGPQEDRFQLQLLGPPGHSVRFMQGNLTTYMGLDAMPLRTGFPRHPAPASRVQPPKSYARLPWSNFATPAALAAAVAASASTYTWPAFDIGIWLPGGVAPVVAHIDGGHALLHALAQAVEEALVAVLPVDFGIQVSAHVAPAQDAVDAASGGVCADDRCAVGLCSGLVFENTSGVLFRVQLPLSPSLGYTSGFLTPWAAVHAPNDVVGPHFPLWCNDSPFPADLQATVNSAGALVLQCVPFAPFAVTATVPTGGCPGLLELTVAPSIPTFLPGLVPGALVQVVWTSVVLACVVVAAPSLHAFTVRQLNGSVPVPPIAPGTDVFVAPMDAPPLVLYMQTAGATVGRVAPVPASLLGFQPDTYASCIIPAPGAGYSLTSPGTVRVRADPFLLLCLSFYATDANVLTGDVYYPLETPSGGSQLVFAQVLRCGAEFRSDYERVFNHSFPGAGMHLGYIRVKILNADGSPYQTHGHHVSVCLRMDVMTDHVSLGGPSHMATIPLPAPPPPASAAATAIETLQLF